MYQLAIFLVLKLKMRVTVDRVHHHTSSSIVVNLWRSDYPMWTFSKIFPGDFWRVPLSPLKVNGDNKTEIGYLLMQKNKIG